MTRRGNFLDPIFRINRKVTPASVNYDLVPKWKEFKTKVHVKFYEAKRNTFIDDINNKKRF